MNVYHNLSLACLGGSILLIMVSVFLFIRLEIRTAWSVVTGRRGKTGRGNQAALRQRVRKGIPKLKADEKETEKEQETTILEYGNSLFYVEREMMLIYTEECIDWRDESDLGEKE